MAARLLRPATLELVLHKVRLTIALEMCTHANHQLCRRIIRQSAAIFLRDNG